MQNEKNNQPNRSPEKRPNPQPQSGRRPQVVRTASGVKLRQEPKKTSEKNGFLVKVAALWAVVCAFFVKVGKKIGSFFSDVFGKIRDFFGKLGKNKKNTEKAPATKTDTPVASTSEEETAPEKPKKPKVRKKRRRSKPESAAENVVLNLAKTFTYLACVAVAGAILGIAIVLIGNDVFGLVKDDRSVELEIPENATIEQVATILGDNGCISYPKVFKLYCELRHEKGDFKAGTYTVSTSWDYDDFRYEFKEKKPEGTIRLMIPEGSTTDEIIDIMVGAGIGTRENYIKEINEGEFEYWFVDDLNKSGWSKNRYYRLDGYLFPDTYDFYLASSEWSVINKLLRRFKEIYTDSMKTKAAALGLTTDQVVILASMVEKEAFYASDLSTISSVFHNRLTNSFLFPYMQSDATIAYAMQHDTGVRPSDSEINKQYVSPYNTYLFRGLPPGAIANPGYAALAAALYPSKTAYYYFVSYPTGYTLYATTLQEHNNNIEIIKQSTAKK